jgi:hypothetical protein
LTFLGLRSSSPKGNSWKYGMFEAFEQSEVAALRLFPPIRPLVLLIFSHVKAKEAKDYGNGTISD